MLPEFSLLRPRGLAEALGMLATGDVVPVAGGTNVIVDLRSGRREPSTLMDTSRLPELHGIRLDQAGGHLVVGAGVTITELLHSPLIAEYAVALLEAASVFANPLIRNRATVGGNLVDASPAADTAPPLLALDAEVELASASGSRRLPLGDFLVGVRKTLLRPEELLVAVRCPVHAAPLRSASAFHKVGLRKSDAISVVSASVSVTCDAVGRCLDARIALGAVAPRPVAVHSAAGVLVGTELAPQVVAEAARLAALAARPISDIRGSAGYRQEVTQVVVRRLLTACVGTVGVTQAKEG